MALLKRFRNLASRDNSGFGANPSNSGSRFFDRETGAASVSRRGVGILSRYSWYHTMLGMKSGKFLLLLLLIYISANFVFAGIYYLIGVHHLAGIPQSGDWKEFSEVFFFSTQTFTTVGYGRISPVGFWASAVATFEAFLGLLSFALATGLFYGRFSRPRAFLHFSQDALVSPYRDGTALMLRLSPYKNNALSDAVAEVTLALQVEENGKPVNKFYDLPLAISEVNSLALSWTLVHPINEESPLYGFTENDLRNTRMEVMVFIKAFDEVFSNTVVARWSYVNEEIVWGAKYRIMFYASENRRTTIIDHHLLNAYDKAELPATAANGSLS